MPYKEPSIGQNQKIVSFMKNGIPILINCFWKQTEYDEQPQSSLRVLVCPNGLASAQSEI
jgi:hypothetical protein